jgi:hypothetical protein
LSAALRRSSGSWIYISESRFGYFRTSSAAKPTSGFSPKADLKLAMSVFDPLTTALAPEADIQAAVAYVRL